MALLDSFGREINQVLFEGNSCVKKVIFNRPRKFNSITIKMILEMLKKLKEYEDDSTVKLVILKGNGKAFCSGGDLKALYKHATEGHWTFGALLYKKLLTLSHLLATYKKPLVALIDGTVMGAGAGLSMHAPYRIVTENTVFAMPEASVGLFPDIGASHFLSRLPKYFGEYLGLTGAKLDGAEMVACGLATHFVLSKDLHLHMLENALEGLTSSDTTAISHIISKFEHKASVKQDNAYYSRSKIVNKCFSRETVEDIQLALKKEAAANWETNWIVDAINSMKSACPASLKIFLRMMKEGRNRSLEHCLTLEYIVHCHIIRETLNSEFYEGVRAKLLHKDKKPKWRPSKLELVSEEMVDQFFRIMDDGNWEPLQLTPTTFNSFIIDAARPKL
ncbi:3-hydroxyisobutyryl-CoA hydrolase 1 [Melia azedarach]|uniref:3-hydroxyisobutyryl-CoA hydrolase 1 n=1 Tax=Melia azedarach TaxID=155640 RepID=A0ACC1X8B0_MELAZ|nr:3-hydroxyisobutyryl-CoA hydrolase 1 [Melia azedarach]